MIIDKNLINEAKQKFGDKAASIIAKELKFEKFDERNMKACCKWHSEDTPSLIWNTQEYYWKCFGCGKVYGILDHYMEHEKLTYLEAVEKMFQETGIQFRFSEKNVKTKRDYKYPDRINNADRKQVEKYLESRKISKKTLDYCDVQQDDNGNIVFHYYDTNDVLLTAKYRPARQLKDGEAKAWAQKGKDSTPILFNMHKIDVTQPLLLQEGEIDCISAIECGYKNAVSVPFGANNYGWIEECWNWLEQFNKIIIFSDNDEPGIKMRKEIITRLGTWRCYYVDLPQETGKDANEVLCKFGKEKLRDIIENAQEAPIGNVVDFADIEDLDISKIDGIYTHIEGLDKKMSKLFFGTFNIFTGINSSGKSSLLNQVCVCQALHQGYNVFMYSGELPNWQLKNWLLSNLAGGHNTETHKREGQPDYYTIKPEIKKEIGDYYRGRLHIYDNPKDHTATTIINKMTDLARRYGTKVFVIDNFTVVNLESKSDDKWDKQKDFIVNLIDFAVRYNVLVVLVVHPHKMETIRKMNKMDIQGTSAAIDLAHRIFGVHRVRPNEKEGEKTYKGDDWKVKPNKFDVMINIFKDRLMGCEDVDIGCYYDYPSRRFYSNEKELNFQYSWDKKVHPVPMPNPHKNDEPEILRDRNQGEYE